MLDTADKKYITINHLEKSYMRPDGTSFPIFQNFSLQVEIGKITCFMGVSGCGKTTLVNMIAGFEAMDKGEIFYGKDPLQLKKLKIGIIFQNNVLFPWKTVMDNILFACKQEKIKVTKEVVMEYLEKTNLKGVENCYPGELSGGMCQRIALIRLFLINPDLVILDEAFGALDVDTRYQMQKLFLESYEEKHFTAIVITHDIMEALRLGDHILLFRNQPCECEIIENVHRMSSKDAFGTDHIVQMKEAYEKIVKMNGRR